MLVAKKTWNHVAELVSQFNFSSLLPYQSPLMTSGVPISQVPPALVRCGCFAVAALARPALIAVGLSLVGSGMALAANVDSSSASATPPSAAGIAGAPGERAAERPMLSIELRPSRCYLSGSVSSAQMADDLSFAISETFPRRCFSHRLEIAGSASNSTSAATDLPLEIEQLPDLLRELAASPRPVRIDWFPGSHRLVIRGHAYSRVTVAAMAMRVRMASRVGTADGIIFENRIEVIAQPRSRVKSSLALATVIERDFENVELPLLPPVEFQPIYFTHRDSVVDRQEMPKLLDALDQISTAHPDGNWPRLLITGYALPRGDQIAEIADGLIRAGSVRDSLVALGIPEDRFIVQSVAGNKSLGLTWRSRRVEISVAPDSHETEALVTSLSPADR